MALIDVADEDTLRGGKAAASAHKKKLVLTFRKDKFKMKLLSSASSRSEKTAVPQPTTRRQALISSQHWDLTSSKSCFVTLMFTCGWCYRSYQVRS